MTVAPAPVTTPITAPVTDTAPIIGAAYGDWSPAPHDGQIAFVSDRTGAQRAWVRRWGGGATRPLPTGDEPVLQVSWSPDGAWIACLIAPGGAPRNELWLIRPDGTGLHQVAGFGAATAVPGGWDRAGRLLVTETGTQSLALAYDPLTGERHPLLTGDLLALLDISADGRTALLRRGPRSARELIVADLADGTHRRVAVGAGPGSTDRGRLSADGKLVYARTDVGTELARLVAVPAVGRRPSNRVSAGRVAAGRVLAERADAELEDVVGSPPGDTLALLWNRYGGCAELALLDPGTGVQRTVPAPPGVLVLGEPAFSADGRWLTLTAQGPDLPRSIWMVEVASAAGTLLDEDRPYQDLPVGAEPELFRLASHDGLPISGWLYRPAGPGPFPTAVYLHGGPEAQERPGHQPLYTALVGQGIAVFAANVRGSSGFGRSFVAADDRERRFAAIDDVAACVRELVSVGVAQPGRIACLGRSYGGYLTLAALTSYPELFATGVDVCGMSDLVAFYAETEPWIGAAAVSKYGHPEHDHALLQALSPLPRIDRLAAPLLVIHGGNDTNVPVGESERLVAELRRHRMPHRYLRFDGEGHEFLGRAAHDEALRATVDWLAEHLAG
jgi:dipeptidyl aminopeptidase/acylaminoacyl peptidase